VIAIEVVQHEPMQEHDLDTGLLAATVGAAQAESPIRLDDFHVGAGSIHEITPSGDVSSQSTPQPTGAASSPARHKTVLRDKWDLWNGPTSLRGANIWQKRVNRNDAMGDGPVGPPYNQQDFDRLARGEPTMSMSPIPGSSPSNRGTVSIRGCSRT